GASCSATCPAPALSSTVSCTMPKWYRSPARVIACGTAALVKVATSHPSLPGRTAIHRQNRPGARRLFGLKLGQALAGQKRAKLGQALGGPRQLQKALAGSPFSVPAESLCEASEVVQEGVDRRLPSS